MVLRNRKGVFSITNPRMQGLSQKKSFLFQNIVSNDNSGSCVGQSFLCYIRGTPVMVKSGKPAVNRS